MVKLNTPVAITAELLAAPPLPRFAISFPPPTKIVSMSNATNKDDEYWPLAPEALVVPALATKGNPPTYQKPVPCDVTASTTI
jgi:hypothetical protein